MGRESKFQKEVINELHGLFPDGIVLKNDSSYLQGFPDLMILSGNKWAVLEVKSSASSSREPNQTYWVSKAKRMAYGAFISPENKEEVLRELEQALRS
jgi:hypothetical protein